MTVNLPCRVGDVVWGISRKFDRRYIGCGDVSEIYFSDKSMTPAIRVHRVCTGFWGVDVFATEREALAAVELEKRRKNYEGKQTV